jgi:hypothetical protein
MGKTLEKQPERSLLPDGIQVVAGFGAIAKSGETATNHTFELHLTEYEDLSDAKKRENFVSKSTVVLGIGDFPSYRMGVRTKSWTTLEVVHVFLRRANARGSALYRIGQIFNQKRLIGDIQLIKKTLILSLASTTLPEELLESSKTYRPTWVYKTTLLGKSKKAIPDEKPVLIPMAEILRRFYTPTSRLAAAFVNGPWSLERNTFFEENGVTAGDDGAWTIDIGEKSTTAIEATLAALFELDTGARTAATNIYTDHLARSAATPPDPLIKCGFPVKSDGYEIEVEGIFRKGENGIGTKTFFVCRILKAPWPTGNQRVTICKQVRKSADPDPNGLPSGKIYPAQPTTPKELKSVDSSSSPENASNPAHIETEDILWSNAPRVLKKKRTRVVEPNGSRTQIQANDSDTGSTDGRSSQGGGQGISYDQAWEDVDEPIAFLGLYEDLKGIIEALRIGASIDSWDIVYPAPENGTLRGDTSVWVFESLLDVNQLSRLTKGRWRWLSLPEIESVRTAMVLQITAQEKSCYWVEIERGSDGSFCSLLFTFSGADLNTAVTEFLKETHRSMGHPSGLGRKLVDLGLGNFKKLKHETKEGLVNKEWALMSIKEVLGLKTMFFYVNSKRIEI